MNSQLFTALLVIIWIIVAILAYFAVFASHPSELNQTISSAIKTKSVNMCYKIKGTNERNSCLYDLAASSENSTICSLIDAPYLVDKCNFHVANLTHNPDICIRIRDAKLRLSCYAHVFPDHSP